MLDARTARPTDLSGMQGRLYLGRGSLPFEIVVVESDRTPTLTDLRSAHRIRAGKRPAPVLLVWQGGDDCCAVYGPSEVNPVEHLDLPATKVERVCEIILDAPDRHHGIRTLHHLLPQLDAPVPGLRNGGLLALQELEHGVPARPDWAAAGNKGASVRLQRGRDLIQGLGFDTRDVPGPGLILYADGSRRAVGILLDRIDEVEASSDRYDGTSAVSYALALADRENLDYVLVTADASIRLYPVKPGVGVGRRGRAETYVEVNLDLLPKDQAGYLWLLFSGEALADGGSFEQILARSEDYAASLGSELRDRVYVEVVPRVAKAAFDALGVDDPAEKDLRTAYDVALRMLFRTLFVAYGEDRDLLPLHSSKSYREHSLKRIAQRLAEARVKGVEWSEEPYLWHDLQQIWRAVDRGNAEWGVPPYNGGLFSSDPAVSVSGEILSRIEMPDSHLAPALAALLLNTSAEGLEGPIDFRSLGVREFGTMYEGLLESELAVAKEDLREKGKKRELVPAGDGDEVAIAEGEVYLHNRSGARKTTGSYYTKMFAVEHLLDRALEPALEEHLGRLDEMGDREAGKRFFEFRVADIAMGSGHFLVTAIDRIERRLVSYLAERPLPDVTEELARLRRVAMETLGADWSGEPIEDGQLLRRQIARRCIYGVDLNAMAVELARLSIWVHTFVPGLPLSLLDENLVHGNSLVGIATLDEAAELIEGDDGDLFAPVAGERLAAAKAPLEKLGKLADATTAEIAEARELYDELRDAVQADRDLFTILTASRVSEPIQKAIGSGQVATLLEDEGGALHAKLLEHADEALAGQEPLHFPLVFPQVFLGSRGGFDVILGNPPWDQPMADEQAFWARHFPGLRARPQRERERLRKEYRIGRPDLVLRFEAERRDADRLRELLVAGAYPGITAGHPDLYKAFVWRFWDLIHPKGGRIGVVLPRSALATKGGDEFRKVLLRKAETVDLTMIVNNRQWVFAEVHPQYTIGLAAIKRREGGDEARLLLSGPFASLEQFRADAPKAPTAFGGHEVAQWNDTASLPLLPSAGSVRVFTQLRRSPRLDLDADGEWRARPVQGDLNSTTGKPLMDLKSRERPPGFWPVFKGASFDLWRPDTGTYYGWTDPTRVLPELQRRRERATSRSAFVEFPEEWRSDSESLPCLTSRVAYRRVSRATDSRTVRVALVPPNVVLTDKASYLLWPRGDRKDEAFLLGVLSSLPLDWYARRFVETQVDFFVLTPFPIPRPDRNDPLWRRTVALAGRLAAPDDRFLEWAATVGVECGPLERDEKQDMIHEVDALVARLYGLDEPQLRHIFETFHVGWDYEERLRATLAHFETWGSR